MNEKNIKNIFLTSLTNRTNRINFLYKVYLLGYDKEETSKWLHEDFVLYGFSEPQEKIILELLEKKESLEEKIKLHMTQKWSFDRLQNIEKSILLNAFFEIIECKNKKSIIIKESIIHAQRFSDKNSFKIINSIIDKINSDKTINPQEKLIKKEKLNQIEPLKLKNVLKSEDWIKIENPNSAYDSNTLDPEEFLNPNYSKYDNFSNETNLKEESNYEDDYNYSDDSKEFEDSKYENKSNLKFETIENKNIEDLE